MITDDLKSIKTAADEAFEEVSSMDLPEDLKAYLLASLDDVGSSMDNSLYFLSESKI